VVIWQSVRGAVVGEEIFGNRDFSHLKRDKTTVAHHLRADLD
jgi:hypothetical protein